MMPTRLKRAGFRAVNAWPGVLWRLRGAESPFEADAVQGEAVVAISRRKRRLYLYAGGRLAGCYRVGVGDPRARTPTGRFEVQALARDPSWSVPNVPVRFGRLAGATLSPGHDRNRLGPRWIQIHGGYGIHGGPVGPLGIGSTAGCVKMRNADLIELFDRLQVGTPIVIE
jgi:lipoprotein-anchoring transpeptidase ErfK/SrfK